MTDQADSAQRRIEEERAAGIARRHVAIMPAASDCASCGAPIPEARRQAVPGTQLCIQCARRAERRRNA